MNQESPIFKRIMDTKRPILSIPLPFDDLMTAVLQVQPPEKQVTNTSTNKKNTKQKHKKIDSSSAFRVYTCRRNAMTARLG
jgi:hypothetical protein